MANLGVVASGFGCFDLTLSFLMCSSMDFMGTPPDRNPDYGRNRCCLAQLVCDKSLTSFSLGFGMRRYSTSGLEFTQFQPSLF